MPGLSARVLVGTQASAGPAGEEAHETEIGGHS
jgi:hypothetical protein